MVHAVPFPIEVAFGTMLDADPSGAGPALENLVAGQYLHRLLGAGGSMLLANQPTAGVGPAEVSGAVNLAIDRALDLMDLADVPTATGTANGFVEPDRLVAAAFAEHGAIGAEPPGSLGRSLAGSSRVARTDWFAAPGTLTGAGAADLVIGGFAPGRMSGTMDLVATGTGRAVRPADRVTLDRAAEKAMLVAGRLTADGAPVAAPGTDDVIALADVDP
jgi:hypothetical protein